MLSVVLCHILSSILSLDRWVGMCVCVGGGGVQQLSPPSGPSLQQVQSPVCQHGPVSPPSHLISSSNSPSWPAFHCAAFSAAPIFPPTAHKHMQIDYNNGTPLCSFANWALINQTLISVWWFHDVLVLHTARSLFWASASAACFSASWAMAAFSWARFGSTTL